MYKCLACGRQFVGGNRLNSNLIWKEYVDGKQTYVQLATKYNCSTKTIQRKLDSVVVSAKTDFPSAVNILMDTTYFDVLSV